MGRDRGPGFPSYGGPLSSPVTDPDLLAFIRGSIRSVWALELLLLMRNRRDRSWTADGLVQELRASTPLVTDVLGAFEAAGLVTRDEEGRYAYAPASAALDHYCDVLDRTYRERPVSVVNAIVTAPNDKLQNFADAFRLKRGD